VVKLAGAYRQDEPVLHFIIRMCRAGGLTAHHRDVRKRITECREGVRGCWRGGWWLRSAAHIRVRSSVRPSVSLSVRRALSCTTTDGSDHVPAPIAELTAPPLVNLCGLYILLDARRYVNLHSPRDLTPPPPTLVDWFVTLCSCSAVYVA